MSYILDALKKSERERQQENHSPLQYLYEAPSPPADLGAMRRRWPWLLLCGCLFLGGLATLFGWNHWPVADPPPETAALGEIGDATDPPADAGGLSAPDNRSRPGGPAAPSIAQEVVKPIRIPRDRQKIVKILPQPEPATAAGQPRAGLTVAGQPQADPSGKPGSDLPYLQDLSPQLQADVPKLDFAGHAYALEPSQRLIVINGAIMREGDWIDAATRLAEITWEGVIIERKGVRFQVKCY